MSRIVSGWRSAAAWARTRGKPAACDWAGRRSRAALADIDEADLSEIGLHIREEVLRERRELARKKGAAG
jgi:hypothetical protein